MHIARNPAAPDRPAFTLIELLIAIGIIAVLLAFLLSAVVRARDSAARIACANNLHQIGLALAGFNGNNGVFPSNGGWDGRQTIPSAGGGAPFTPETFDFTTSQACYWGVGDPHLLPQQQTGSWAFSILPYMEQDAMFREQAWWASTMPSYICPGRRTATSLTVVIVDANGQYWGGGWTWSKTDYAANLFAIENRPLCRGLPGFPDGLSNTILVGEKAFNPVAEQPQSWYWDEPFFLGGSGGTSRGGLGLLRDGADVQSHYKQNWGSPHAGGVNFLFGDGAVHFLGRGTDLATLSALLTPDGREAVSVP